MWEPVVWLSLSAMALGHDVVSRSTSKITSVKPQFFSKEGSKRVEIQYGPYTVPARTDMNGMKNFEEAPAQMPCTDCLITWMQADFHYMNGTPANANTGLWLHHTVLANTAQKDVYCGQGYQRFFASGNERTEIDICVNGTDEAGYYVAPNDKFGMVSELMNMNDESAEAIVTITYEYIPSPPASFAHVQPLWLDIGPGGGCLGSDRPAYANLTFNYSSPAWVAKNQGRVTFMGSHLHDGGTHLEIQLNGDTVCNSVAHYGQSPAYISTMPMNMTMNGGMTMAMNMTMEDISSISTCSNVGGFKPKDQWSITAFYNTDKRMPMQNTNGSLEEIMGIALVYFVEDTYVNATNGTHILLKDSTVHDVATKAGNKPTNGGSMLTAMTATNILSVFFVGLFAFL